jgi:hypothetical protein
LIGEVKRVEDLATGTDMEFRMTSKISDSRTHHTEKKSDEDSERSGSGTHLFRHFKTDADFLKFKRAIDLVISCSRLWTQAFHTLTTIVGVKETAPKHPFKGLPLYAMEEENDITKHESKDTGLGLTIERDLGAVDRNYMELVKAKEVRKARDKHELKVAEHHEARTKALSGLQENLVSTERLLIKNKNRVNKLTGQVTQIEKKLKSEVDKVVVEEPFEYPATPPMPVVPEIIPTQVTRSLDDLVPTQPAVPIDVDEEEIGRHELALAIRAHLGPCSVEEGFAALVRALYSSLSSSSEAISLLQSTDFENSANRLGDNMWKGIIKESHKVLEETMKRKKAAYTSDEGEEEEEEEERPADKRKKAEEELEKVKAASSEFLAGKSQKRTDRFNARGSTGT